MVLKERNVVVPIPKGVKNIDLFLSHYCYFRECETGPPMTRSSRRTYPEFIQKSLIRSESFFSPRCGCRFFVYISCNCNDLVQIESNMLRRRNKWTCFGLFFNKFPNFCFLETCFYPLFYSDLCV